MEMYFSTYKSMTDDREIYEHLMLWHTLEEAHSDFHDSIENVITCYEASFGKVLSINLFNRHTDSIITYKPYVCAIRHPYDESQKAWHILPLVSVGEMGDDEKCYI